MSKSNPKEKIHLAPQITNFLIPLLLMKTAVSVAENIMLSGGMPLLPKWPEDKDEIRMLVNFTPPAASNIFTMPDPIVVEMGIVSTEENMDIQSPYCLLLSVYRKNELSTSRFSYGIPLLISDEGKPWVDGRVVKEASAKAKEAMAERFPSYSKQVKEKVSQFWTDGDVSVASVGGIDRVASIDHIENTSVAMYMVRMTSGTTHHYHAPAEEPVPFKAGQFVFLNKANGSILSPYCDQVH